MNAKPGKLYLVPTPIGNMEDITLRAINTLRSVDIIACEDTRHTGQLLKKLDISKKLISYHNYNESKRSNLIIDSLQDGQDVAVVTDAGSPGVSDPAYRVVKAAIDNNLEVIPLPGPTALIAAVTASGLPTDRFFFEGFLPIKSGSRKNRMKELAEMPHTLVFYESPHRIGKTLADAQETLGNRPACLAREISKLHEEFVRGTVAEIIEKTKNGVKGELVLIIAGYDKKRNDDDE